MEYSSVIDSDENLPAYLKEYNIVITSIPIETSLGKKLMTSDNARKTFEDFAANNDAISIYTDGSKIAGANFVGSACTCPELKLSLQKSINCRASVYTAECFKTL